MQSFVCGTRLCFGADAPAALAGLHAERVLLVTDPYFAENGTAARYAAAFPGAQVEIFSDVAPDPPLSLVAQGVARLQALRPDTLLALGGGSAIDCAKGIAALGGLPVRLVAVPTTSGSGSEVTSFAILTQDGVKHPLVDPALRPELAILDPALLEALPPRLIAESGMDAVSHCVEAAAARGGKSRDGRAGPQRLPDAAAAAAALVRGRDGRAQRRPSGGLHGGAGL